MPKETGRQAISAVLVDDNEDFLRATANLLRRMRQIDVVGQARSGAEAVEIVRQLRPQLVVTDLNMPGLDGMETARRIKEEWRAAKVIIMSVHDDAEYAASARHAGADAYICKPDLARRLPPVLKAMFGMSGRGEKETRRGKNGGD